MVAAVRAVGLADIGGCLAAVECRTREVRCDVRHGDIDEPPAFVALEVLEARGCRNHARERVGDRVGTEARAAGVVHDEPSGDRGIVTEGHSSCCFAGAAVASDRDPDAWSVCVAHQLARDDTELFESPRSRGLDDDIGGGEKPAERVAAIVGPDVDGNALLASVQLIEERRRPAARRVGTVH